MGRKINPIGFRLAVNRDWSSQWYARKREFADCLVEDYEIRKHIKDNHAAAMISSIVITRLDSGSGPTVKINVARPGVLIGTKGEDIGKLREQLRRITDKQDTVVEVQEVRNPDADATLVAQNIAGRLEKRQRTRRVIQSTLQALARQPSVLGVKIRVKGRLEGADIARKDYRHEGRVPLHTLRADIDYGFAEARTQMGQIGIKVWVFRGERVAHAQDEVVIGAVEQPEEKVDVSASGLQALAIKAKEPKHSERDVRPTPSDQELLGDIGEEYEDMEE
jgi:small subunit ribosomal protein S3